MDTPTYYQRNRERILARQKEYNRTNKEKIANYCKLYHRGYKRATPPRKKKLQPVLPPQLPPLPLQLDVVEEERPFNIMIDNRPHTVRFD